MLKPEFKNKLEQLNLNYLVQNYDEFMLEMHSPQQVDLGLVLETLAEREISDEKNKSLLRRHKSSKIDLKNMRLMADFDWSNVPKLKRVQVEQLLGLEFIASQTPKTSCRCGE